METLTRGFEAWLRSWGAADSTIEARIACTVSYIRHAGTRWRDTNQIVQWLARPTLSPWARYTYWAHLNSFFSWTVKAGFVTTSPMQDVRKPRVPKARPRPLTPREVHQLLTTPTRHPHVVTWLQLGLLQGLRVHEAAKLRGEDLTEDTLFVIGKGAKPAELPTHPEIWRIAQSYPRQGLWFPSRNQPALPQGKRSVITAISRHFERAGVVGTSHRCRHTFATRLLREGVNIRVVQDLMRHSALSSTAAYLAVDADERVAAIRLLGA